MLKRTGQLKSDFGYSQEMRRFIRRILLLVCVLFLVVGCGREREVIVVTATPEAQRPTVAPIPSLYPTNTPEGGAVFTPVPADVALATPTPPRPTATPVDFTDPALLFRYQIPAIGLDRTAEGTLSSVLTLRDLTTGAERVVPDQGRYLLQIEAVLNGLELAPVPDGCDRCVLLSYELPFDGQSASGWLQDSILIASIERLFTNGLGPYFPAETMLGLQRRTSGYTIGHTAAVLSDGTVWAWNAPDAMIDEPLQLSDEELAALISLEPDPLWAENYETVCAYYPQETFQFNELRIDISCPELSLPTTLVEAYDAINLFTADSLADERNIPYPNQPLPLDARIYYERVDGASITIFDDGRYQVQSESLTEPTEGQIRAEEVDGFVADILATDVVPLGVTLITQDEIINEQDGVELDTGEREYEEVILVRSGLGVHEFGWSSGIGQGLVPAITILDVLLIDEIGLPESVEE